MTALNKLFPEINSYEEKEIKILETFYNHGCNISSTAKKLGITRKTLKKLIDEIKEKPVYTKFLEKLEEEIKGFNDEKFINTLFHRYESEYEKLNKLISHYEKAGNEKMFLQLLKLKHSLMAVQLKATLTCKQLNEDKHTPDISIQFRELYDEALQELEDNYSNHGVKQ
jgi:DNA-binding MarR family transcriptional regulator